MRKAFALIALITVMTGTIFILGACAMNENTQEKIAEETPIATGGGSVSETPPAVPNDEPEGIAPKDITLAINPADKRQTMDGWGVSLCWWGNIIGNWGGADYNGNGIADRDELVEMAFSPEYLNLNIVRYNVGGGDDPAHDHIKRVEAKVPGWTDDVNDPAFFDKPTEQMADSGQLWVWEQANIIRAKAAKDGRRENDIKNIVFSNSPPYYMTKSGCSSGGAKGGGATNLEDVDGFAAYLAKATDWLKRDLTRLGVDNAKIDYLAPMNEPASGYWKEGSSKQEGCGFQTANQQNIVLAAARKALDAQGLTDVAMTASDETDVGQAIISYKWLDEANKANVALISTHTYHATDEQRAQLRELAEQDGKMLYMSEVGFGGGAHSETAMGGMELAAGIMADLKIMGVTGWCEWILADSEYEALQNDHNWGLVHAVFEDGGQPVAGYHTNLLNADGTRKAGVPANGFHTTKQFYTMMQFSKFIKVGYTIIETGDAPVLAAISPDGKELVIVASNADAAHSLNADLSAFGAASSVTAFETSAARSCEEISAATIEDGALSCALPTNSVTTFVIRLGE